MVGSGLGLLWVRAVCGRGARTVVLRADVDWNGLITPATIAGALAFFTSVMSYLRTKRIDRRTEDIPRIKVLANGNLSYQIERSRQLEEKLRENNIPIPISTSPYASPHLEPYDDSGELPFFKPKDK